MPCYLQRARTSVRVRSQAILLSYMLHGPPSPNQHIGGRNSAHRMCVGRDDLASSFAIDVPFETDFSVSVYVYACVLTQLTAQPNVVLEQLAR